MCSASGAALDLFISEHRLIASLTWETLSWLLDLTSILSTIPISTLSAGTKLLYSVACS